MKIPKSIIEKYQLTPSGEQTGQSFMQNQLLFKSGLTGFEGVLFMECGFDGKPCKDITFYDKNKKRDGILTPEFMENMEPATVLQFIS